MWVELRRGWGRARRGEEGECILSGGIAGSVRAVLNHDLLGTSLAVQWLGLRALTAKGLGSIPGQETKIPQPATPQQESPGRLQCLLHRKGVSQVSSRKSRGVFKSLHDPGGKTKPVSF